MLGLLPLAGLLFLSGEFGAHGTVVAEGRVGQAPITSSEPQAAAVGLITPVGDVEYEGRAAQMILDYGPHVLWRRPNPLNDNQALVLHVTNLSVTADATPTVRLIERASFSYGKADYQALTRLIPSGSLPPVLDILVLSAGTGLRWDASPTWRYESMFNVEHRRTLGAAPVDMTDSTMASFRQTNLFLDSSGIARVSRRNDLVLTLGVSDRYLDSEIISGVELIAVTPQVGWRTRLTWSTEARLSGGVTYIRDEGKTALLGGGGGLRPVGSAELSGVLLSRHGVAWNGTAGVTLDYFVDPFLQAAGPRAVAVARSQVLFEPNWTVGIDGTFGTSLRATGIPNYPTADETFVEVVLPVRHRLSSSLIVEGGLRWSERAPRIRADNVTFHERQNWVYLSFTATSRRMERWTPPQPLEIGARDEGAFARVQTADAPPGSESPESGVPQGPLVPPTLPVEPPAESEPQ